MTDFFIQNIRNSTVYIIKFDLKTPAGSIEIRADRRMLDKVENYELERLLPVDKIKNLIDCGDYSELFTRIINEVLNKITPLEIWLKKYWENNLHCGYNLKGMGI